MATSGYPAEELPPSQSQGGNVTMASSTQQKATSTTTSQFLSDIQSSPGSAPAQTASIIRAQATPPVTQKKVVLATPPQGAMTAVQYVAGAIQSSASQAGNGQSAQQYIVVTVTGEHPHFTRYVDLTFSQLGLKLQSRPQVYMHRVCERVCNVIYQTPDTF